MPLQRIGLEAGRIIPVTAQGRSTRSAIIRAALTEIDECGYLEARVEAITFRAGVGYGTFYKYFSGKRDLVRAAMIDVFADIFDIEEQCQDRTNFSVDGVYRSVVTRLTAFHRNRRTLRVLGSAIGVDPELATLYHDLQQEQSDSFIVALKESNCGLVPGSEPAVSLAINSLVDETARRWVGADSSVHAFASLDVEQIAATLVPMIMAVLEPASALPSPRPAFAPVSAPGDTMPSSHPRSR